MSFYGNIREDMTKSQFQFDRIYANRYAMDSAVSATEDVTNGIAYKTDGVFVGRFVLVDYNIKQDRQNPGFAIGEQAEELARGGFFITKTSNGDYFLAEELDRLEGGNEHVVTVISSDKAEYFAYYKQEQNKYVGPNGEARFSKIGEEPIDQTAEAEATVVFVNSKVDRDKYGATYDATVWQKVIYHNKEQYVLVAKLNSNKPDIEGRLIAPSDRPEIKELTENSYSFYYPAPWLVNGEVNFGNNSHGDQYIGVKEYDYHFANRDNSVIITKEASADGEYYDATTEALVKGEKEDTLNFVFSIPEFKEALSNFWDLIYGPGIYSTDENGNHKIIEPELENDELINKNYRKIDTAYYPQKTLEDLREIKIFTPSTAAGIINLLQLYLGRGAIPIGVIVPANEKTEEAQNNLATWYEHNYVLPKVDAIGEDGINWENIQDFSSLSYIIKKSIFTPVSEAPKKFSLKDGVLKTDGTKTYLAENGNYFYSGFENGVGCTEDEFNKLYFISGYEYTTKPLMETATSNSVLSLLAELLKLLGSGDPETRDENTIRGLFNSLEDTIKQTQKNLRNSLIWRKDAPLDRGVLAAVYGDPIENDSYTLDNILTALGNNFWSVETGHLIKNVEKNDNEMSARLVLGERTATAYNTDNAEIKTKEPQGIVYHGSKYKTSAIRFLDNETSYGKDILGKDDVAEDGQYYTKNEETGEYTLVNSFSFSVDLEDTNQDGQIDDKDVAVVENSVQEIEFDPNYDYYEVELEEPIYINNEANNAGNGLSLGAGGLTILGAGESPMLFEKYVVGQNFSGAKKIKSNTEFLEILSDEEINFYSGLNEYRNEWDAYNSSTSGHAVLDALEEYWNIYNQSTEAQESLENLQNKLESFKEVYADYATRYGYFYTRDINFKNFVSAAEKDINKKIPSKVSGVTVFDSTIESRYGDGKDRYRDVFLHPVPVEADFANDKDITYYRRRYLQQYPTLIEANLNIGEIYYLKTDTTYEEHVYTGNNDSTSAIYKVLTDSTITEDYVFVRLGGLDGVPAGAESSNGYYLNYYYWSPPAFTYYSYNDEDPWSTVGGDFEGDFKDLKEPSISTYLSYAYNNNNGLYFRPAKTEDLTTKSVLFFKTENDVYRPVVNLKVKITGLKMADYSGDKKTLLNTGYQDVKGSVDIGNFESLNNYYVLNDTVNLKETLEEYINSEENKNLNTFTNNSFFWVTVEDSEDNDSFRIDMSKSPVFSQYFSENTLTEDNFSDSIWIAPISVGSSIYQVIKVAPDQPITAWKALLSDLRPDIEDYRAMTINENTVKVKKSLTLEEDLILTNENKYLAVGNNLVYDNRRITYGTEAPTADAIEGDLYIQLIS